MADLIDRANDEVERQLENKIKSIRNTSTPVKYTGYCLTCGEELPAPRRWCDKDCCDDFNK